MVKLYFRKDQSERALSIKVSFGSGENFIFIQSLNQVVCEEILLATPKLFAACHH